MNDKENIIQIITLAIIAGIGGAVHYVGKYMDKSEKLPLEMVGKAKLFKVNHFIAQMFVSAFCGALVGYAFTKTFPDWSYVIAGFSGIFGLELLRLLLLLAVKVFGSQTGVDVSDVKLKKDD